MEAARSSLKEMRNSTGYDSDSPEARLAKVHLHVFTAVKICNVCVSVEA